MQANFPRRVRTLQAELARQGIDVLVGTRLKTITHVSGAFVPWRSAVVIPSDGEAQLFTVSMDAVRVAKPSQPGRGAQVELFPEISVGDAPGASGAPAKTGRAR